MSRHDPANDDPADGPLARLPDGLIVRRARRSMFTPAPSAMAGRGRTAPESTRRRLLGVAIDLARKEVPGIGSKGLVRRLRHEGWPDVTRSEVEALLPPPLPGARVRALSAVAVRRKPAPAPVAMGEAELSRLRTAALRIRGDAYGITLARVTQRLRENGWPEVTEEQVEHAVRRPRSSWA
ncbi:hypothetical protein Ade02nite_07690 [Paractinoplanes deccanensis]|uniref:Regulatory protein RecX n=1 Tax=Paractinoplanes deccanensis TaxID=113561 RepID=A0ABQ3XWL4_9ACTN|nr:hypothetical protein [Actinoplanes deccanensis]GID72128.1 hypothetical protein Ade02nite_07690 [Actinoplanes deccanensis]